MTTDQPDKEQIFGKAAELQDPAERAAYLQEVCGPDAALRAEIEELLEHDQQADSFLDAPPPGANVTTDSHQHRETVGTRIGHYKLLQEIGEGGMGTVFLAEQLQPVKRRVALKIVKYGMDTRRFIARFEAERNALAMMDHPNIARVLDAGATETGRPYFVMELVKGVPITTFCDDNKLTARQRLELFVDVCHGVQHAHQKGIIHRDLKPSNVLVALYDDQPVPKIIDFGVAKATNQQLTEKTLFTQIGQIVGTLEYMSPEQAVLNQLDVDTRADIYSLGVILYELLTGVTPIERDRLRSAGLEEMLRVIREEEPPKPSTRVSTLGAATPSLAAYRGTNAGSLAQTLRGDLDWIVMKALEKKRARRYETANAFAGDLARYLNDQPVEACPPSAMYRIRKFTRRNRAIVGTLVAVGLVLVLGLIGTLSGWIAQWKVANTLEQKKQELQARLDSLQDELKDRALNAAVSGDCTRAMDAITKAEMAHLSPDLLRTLKGLALFYSGRSDDALSHLESAVRANPRNVSAQHVLAFAYDHSGMYDEWSDTRDRITAQNLVPKTDYDKLFWAQFSLVGSQKNDVIEQLNKLISSHRYWGIAYTIRCRAWSEVFVETKDLDDCTRAVDDATIAQTLTPGNPFTLATCMITYVRAIELSESLEQDTTQLRAGAAKLASALKQWPDYILGREMRATYFALINQPDLVRGEEKALLKRGAGGPSTYGASLVEQNRVAELRDFRRGSEEDSIGARHFRAYALAISADETERKRALQIFRDLDVKQAGYVRATLALDIPLLLGQPDIAKAESLEIVKQGLPPQLWVGWERRAEYLAGRETEQAYLDHAGPFRDRWCNAHYTIGLKAFAEGDFEKAREYLTIVATKTGKISWWSYRWAKAILACMDRDPNWPNWIPRSTTSKQ